MKELAPIRRIRPVARRALAAQSDERLVKLLREGHDAAFDEIVGRYQGPLTAFAAAFIPYHRAEDVVQASLLKAHKALLDDDREIALRAWLFTIVRNGALNAIRDEPDWQELDPAYDGVPQPPAIAEQNEDLQRLVVAICALPDAQRRALVGRELEGEGHAELAGELGTTATAVRGLIFRARTTLRDALGALIPLPVIRMLLTQGSTAGAGAGAGLGLGAASLGGGAKVAASIAAAALVVGGGFALEKKNGGREGGTEVAKAATEASDSGSAVASGRTAGSGSASAAMPGADGHGAGSGSGSSKDSGNPDPGDNSGVSDSSGPGSGSSGSGSGKGGSSGPSGHESGHEPGDDDSSGPGPGPMPEPGDDDGGHSGSGGGDDGIDDGGSSGSGGGELPEPGDAIDDGGSSGSGGGEDTPEPEDSFDDGGGDEDHSGSGGVEEQDDD